MYILMKTIDFFLLSLFIIIFSVTCVHCVIFFLFVDFVGHCDLINNFFYQNMNDLIIWPEKWLCFSIKIWFVLDQVTYLVCLLINLVSFIALRLLNYKILIAGRLMSLASEGYIMKYSELRSINNHKTKIELGLLIQI